MYNDIGILLYVRTITRHSTPYICSFQVIQQQVVSDRHRFFSHLSEPTFTTAENRDNTGNPLTVARELNKPREDIQKFEGNQMVWQIII